MKKRFLFIFLFPLLIFSQNQIQGIVIDNTTKKPLPFASIITNTNAGTLSDVDGKFFIKTTSSFNEITVSYIGYKKVNIPISNNTNYIKIELNSSTESLNEIVNSDTKVENCPVVNYNEDVILYTSGENNSFSPDINMAAMNMDYKIDKIYFTHFVDTAWTEPIIINDQIKAGKNIKPMLPEHVWDYLDEMSFYK